MRNQKCPYLHTVFSGFLALTLMTAALCSGRFAFAEQENATHFLHRSVQVILDKSFLDPELGGHPGDGFYLRVSNADGSMDHLVVNDETQIIELSDQSQSLEVDLGMRGVSFSPVNLKAISNYRVVLKLKRQRTQNSFWCSFWQALGADAECAVPRLSVSESYTD